MKKLWMALLMVCLMALGTGCAGKAEKTASPAPTLEQQLSESHQRFEERKETAHTGFIVCVVIVSAGVLFKVIAIISAAVIGTRHGKQIRKGKEEREKNALRDTQTNYQRELERYGEYMKERRERERKNGR